MSVEVPPPESPFEPRPSASAASESKTDATASAAAPPGHFLPITYPLTSFANTPHNIACIGFLLGAVWSIGLLSSSRLLTSSFLTWTTDPVGPPSSGLIGAILSPALGLYMASWAIFHLLEFVVTSMYNPAKLSVSSYLLDNGKAYHVAHAVGIIEHILEEAYLPAEYRKYKHMAPLVLFGLVTVVAGQILRSGAMITASSNFSHVVAFKKLDTHSLVTTGIYSWSRHPSYAGFFWWAVGTQILLVNPIGALAFTVVLFKFFVHRIKVEEQALVRFFGNDYIKYRERVPTRILFIR